MYKYMLLFVFLGLFCKDVICRRRNFLRLGTKDNKIVGGTAANIKSYPYQAFLKPYDAYSYFNCGGSIISNEYIVTAAHCLDEKYGTIIRIGSSNKDSGGITYNTTLLSIHPKYDENTLDYDVGVVRVKSKMNLDGINAKTIKMVTSGYQVTDNATLVVTGWGLTSEYGITGPSVLQVVEVNYITRDKCNKRLPDPITSINICAGVSGGGKDACRGDSGGPAVIKESSLLVGIVSYGYGCALPKIPSVYVNVGNEKVRSYIKKISGI